MRKNYLYVPKSLLVDNYGLVLGTFTFTGKSRNEEFTVSAYEDGGDYLLLPREADLYMPVLAKLGVIEDWNGGEAIDLPIQDSISFKGREYQIPAWEALSENPKGIFL